MSTRPWRKLMAAGCSAALVVSAAACSSSRSSGGPAQATGAFPHVTTAAFAGDAPAQVFATLAQFKRLAVAGKGKIAVLLPETTTTRWVSADEPYFQQAFAAVGLKPADYMILNAQGSAATQRTQAEQAITNGASVLLMTNLDSGSGAAIESAAKQAGVATIDYDRLTLNGSAPYYVTFDNEGVGRRMAEGLVKCVAAWHVKNPHVYHLGGSPTDNNATLVERGYDAVLNKQYRGSGWMKVGAVRVPRWDNQQAQTMFEQAYQAHPDINAVLSGNDGFAQSVISILKNAKVPPRTVPTTGQDATIQGLQNLMAGYQCMTVYKPIYREVATAVALAVSLRAKVDPSALVNSKYDAGSHKIPTVLLDPVDVTATTINSTVIHDGFVKRSQLCTGSFARLCARYGIKQ